MSGTRSISTLVAGGGRWSRALDAAPFEVVARPTSAHATVSAASELSPLVAVVAAELDGGGFDAAVRIARMGSGTRVVLVSSWLEDGDVVAGVAAGLSGYVSATAGDAALRAAVAGVARGEMALSRRHVGLVGAELARVQRRLEARPPGVSGMEAEALRLRGSGMSTSAIADHVRMPELDVRRVLRIAGHKLEDRDRAQVRYLRDA